jgi:hypothetical protein
MRCGKIHKGSNKDNLANRCLKCDYNSKEPNRVMFNKHNMCSSSRVHREEIWWASLRGIFLGALVITRALA